MVRDLKKIILVLFIAGGMSVSYAQVSSVAEGIDAYKSGNYEACVTAMNNVVKNDPTDVVAYYYLGLAYTKIGKKNPAIQNYNKVINLNTDSSLSALAKQGKEKLNIKKNIEPELQLGDTEDDYNPIFNDGVVEERTVKKNTDTRQESKTTKIIKASDYAASKENLVPVQKNTYDPNREPTNEDIVNAIRTLQKAGLLQNGVMGLSGNANNNLPMDSRTQQMNSMLMMMNNGNNNNNMMQMMPYMNNGGKMDPQMMQMMLMQQMMPNFGGNNNNNNGY